MDLVILQSLSYVAAAIGVCVAAIYYTLNLRAAIKTREAQLFMEIFDRFNDTKFWEGINETRRAEFEEFLEKTNTQISFEAYNRLVSIGAYFEGIGVLLKRGLINIKLVNDFMPFTILGFYKNIKPLIQSYIESGGSRYRWKGYQYLYRAVKETSESHLKEWGRYLESSIET